MDLRIEINEAPQEVDYQAILAPLREYNQAQTGLTGAEKFAILIKDDMGATQGIWLDTFSFQAPDFYLRFGFSIFGELKDYPVVGYNRFFMQKRFDLNRDNPSNTQP